MLLRIIGSSSILVTLNLLIVSPLFSSDKVYLSKTSIDSIGDIVVVYLNGDTTSKTFVRPSYNTNLLFPFYKSSNTFFSVIPIPPDIRVKELALYIERDGKVISSNTVILEYLDKIDMKPKKLTLPKQSREILKNKERISSDIHFIVNTISKIELESFVSDRIPIFSLPSTNRITSPFGVSRVYSDGRIRYHRGVDFSFEPDDNVYAVADGVVVISSNFLANGESIYIYHGVGIVSSYFHLKERYVNAGERVMRGQIIGKIGQTGISTAPHLHLGMYVVGVGGYVAFNPLTFITNGQIQ
ncbi:MAG: M23 family metallopeptidase [Spirochaetia bacterium]|nr:M23 family metallopeptidase [Spirochaetota bacterium]MCX8096633.1 M23 family metallopeptidase [Spirochaetota bacterium]MDW8112080.1 M23 family metallopeptidase [Spirochaetia bacterium]